MRISDWSSDVVSSDLGFLIYEGRKLRNPLAKGIDTVTYQRNIFFQRLLFPGKFEKTGIVRIGRFHLLHKSLLVNGHFQQVVQNLAESLKVNTLFHIRWEERQVGKTCVSTCHNR